MVAHARFQSAFVPSIALFALCLSAPAAGEFVHGRLYVTVGMIEGCLLGGGWIRELNVRPGFPVYVRTIVAPGDGMCDPTGIAFHPQGDRLFVSNFNSTVTAHRADGTGIVQYDWRDGLLYPEGYNNIAFDAYGNCYVSGLYQGIIKIDTDGFAQRFTAHSGHAIAFAPNGYLYATGSSLRRFDPFGAVETVDSFPYHPTERYVFAGLAIDRWGNVFVSGYTPDGIVIYRYENGRSDQRRILVSGIGGIVLALSADQQFLYSAADRAIRQIDAITGDLSEIFRITGPDSGSQFISGMTAFTRAASGDCNCDGLANFDDIAAFVLALVSDEAYATTHGTCYIGRADCNRDGRVDFDDIPAFVACITYGCPAEE